MGGDWYCRANGDALFEVPKPLSNIGIGYDQIPDYVRHSDQLTGNDLGKLGNIEQLPTSEEIDKFLKTTTSLTEEQRSDSSVLFELSRKLLEQNKVFEAWCALLAISE